MTEQSICNVVVAFILIFIWMFWEEIRDIYFVIIGKRITIKGMNFVLNFKKDDKDLSEYFINIEDYFDKEYKLIKITEDLYHEIYSNKRNTKKEILVSIFCKIHSDGLLEAVRIRMTKINPK